jgi:hypothetical protein
VSQDMDSYDLEDVHPDVRDAMRLANIEIAEPERYIDDPDDENDIDEETNA